MSALHRALKYMLSLNRFYNFDGFFFVLALHVTADLSHQG